MNIRLFSLKGPFAVRFALLRPARDDGRRPQKDPGDTTVSPGSFAEGLGSGLRGGRPERVPPRAHAARFSSARLRKKITTPAATMSALST